MMCDKPYKNFTNILKPTVQSRPQSLLLERRFSSFATSSEPKQQSTQTSRRKSRSFSMDLADFLAGLLEEIEDNTSHGNKIHIEKEPTSSFAEATGKQATSEAGMPCTVQQQGRVPLSSSCRRFTRSSFSSNDADFFLAALLEGSSRETNLKVETALAGGYECDTDTAEYDCVDPPVELGSSQRTVFLDALSPLRQRGSRQSENKSRVRSVLRPLVFLLSLPGNQLARLEQS
jgi:hypothetical protein